MRSVEEVGGFKVFGEEANEAYRTYASAYLDFVDDNFNHFVWRDHDIDPINELKAPSDENIKKAYLDAAVDILKTTISGGYWKSFEDIFVEYPMLRERKDELEQLIYEGKEK